MSKLKQLITNKLISGCSLTILICIFSIFISFTFLNTQKHSHAESIFIDLKPEPVSNSDYPVYRVQKLQHLSSQITALLKLESEGNNNYGGNIDFLAFTAVYVDKDIIRFQISDKPRKIWQVEDFNQSSLYLNNNYELLINNYPFGIEIKDKKDGSSIFNSVGTNFYFSQRYVEFSSFIRENSIKLAVGERKGSILLPLGNHTIWPNADNPGHHPLYLEVLNKSASGFFFHNFNAMEVELTKSQIKYRTTGGIVDFFIILGKNAEEVVRNFHTVAGLPDLPQFNDLGHHYGQKVNDVDDVLTTLDFFEKNSIPVDRFWLKDFTQFDKSFQILSGFQNISEKIKKYNVEVSVTISSEITENSEFFENLKPVLLPYQSNSEKGFMRYIDWFHQDSTRAWHDILDYLQKQTNFSGLVLTNNEVSTGDNTEINSISLPYSPPLCLECGAIPLNTLHVNSYKEIDLHSLWGDMQVKSSRKFFLKQNLRPSIFSSSTRSGSPAFHLFNQNRANWDLFRESLHSVLTYEMFGIRSGSNICSLKTLGRLEMCLRWYQISTILPLAINIKDEPVIDAQVFDKTILSGVQKSILMRYSLSLYIYSLYFEASLHGGTVIKPVLFEFLEEQSIYYPHQVMLGSGLLAIFSMFEKTEEILAYFPKATWFNLLNGNKEIGKADSKNIDLGSWFNLYIRDGFIIPLVNSEGVSRISHIREKGLNIIIALNELMRAKGVFYIDDGISADTIKTKKFTKVIIEVHKEEKLVIKISNVIKGYHKAFKTIEKIKVYGHGPVNQVTVNNEPIDFTYKNEVLEVKLSISTFEQHYITVI